MAQSPIPLPHHDLQRYGMTSEESRAVSFVGVLLCLAFAARMMNRPKPISISAGPVDLAALRAESEAMMQQPHATSSKRPRRTARTTTTAPPAQAAPQKWAVPEWRHPRPLQEVTISAPDQTVTASSGKIDINSASEAELTGLPGVGPAMAKRIVARRDSLGRFSTVEDLDAVRGIGPSLLARLRSLVVAR